MNKIKYASCGLNNIFLLNGYSVMETENGTATSIHNIDGLHEAIGISLCNLRRPLNGDEFRFLRIELDMSQKALGMMLGKSDQAIAKWEKGEAVPLSCDIILRNIFMEHSGDNPLISKMIERINNLDRSIQELELTFQETEGMEWKSAA